MVAFWQSVSAQSGSTGADPVVTPPAGTGGAPDEWLIGIGCCAAAQTITVPGGGTGFTVHPNSLSAAYPFFYRKVDGTEPADWTFVVSGTSSSVIVIALVRGAHPTTPFDDVKGQSVAATANPTIPTMTSAGASRLLLQFASRLTATTWTPPGTVAERWDTQAATASQTTAGGDEIVGAGATGTRAWASASTTGVAVAYGAPLAPAPAKTGTFTGTYDFTGSGFTGAEGSGEGSFTGGYDFTGSGFNGEAPGVSSGLFTGGYDFTGSAFTGVAPPSPSGDGRWTPGGRDRFTARRTPKNRRRSR